MLILCNPQNPTGRVFTIGRILECDYPLPPESDDSAPLGGAGPAVVGEVEPPSLDRYGQLDASKASPQEQPSESNLISAAADGKKEDEGGARGA